MTNGQVIVDVKSIKVRKGGSVHLNATLISEYGFKTGDKLRIEISQGKIVIVKK